MKLVDEFLLCCFEYWVELSLPLQEVGVMRCMFILQVVVKIWDESLVAVAVLLWWSLIYGLQTCLYFPVKNYT